MKIRSDKKYYVNYCQFPRGKMQFLNSLILPDNQTSAAARADAQALGLMLIPRQEARPDGHTQGLIVIPSPDPRPDAQGRAMTLRPRQTQRPVHHAPGMTVRVRFLKQGSLNNFFYPRGIGELFRNFEALWADPPTPYIIPNKRGHYGD